MSDKRINRARGVDLEDLDVVVVDDSKPMQTIVRSMLNAARVNRVRTFDNVGDAYRAMLVEPPHVVITDWNLPDADGLALARMLRDRRSGPLTAVPVILITGHATRRLVEKAIAAGVHFVLAKPLSPASVMKRINALLRDDRNMIFDRARGHYVLEGAEELLAGQRQRWLDLSGGTQGALRLAAARRAAAKPEPTKPATAPVEPPVPAGRSRSFGLGVPVRPGPVETSTGQASPQAS